MDPDALLTIIGTWGYPALLTLLVLTAVGSPIPEDLLLLTTGYLVSAGVFEWPSAIMVGGVGVVASDVMLYSAGRHIAWRSNRWPDPLSPRQIQRATRWFTRFGNKLVLVARLVPGTRALVFVTAGIHSIPISSFLRYDILGAAVWVPAMLAAGHTLGHRVGSLSSVVDRIESAGTAVFLLACVVLLTWFWLGREESKL